MSEASHGEPGPYLTWINTGGAASGKIQLRPAVNSSSPIWNDGALQSAAHAALSFLAKRSRG
jgi:hypothetical protein